MGIAYRMPIMMFRMDETAWQRAGLDESTARTAARMVSQLEEAGMPLLDNLCQMNLDQPQERLEQTKQALNNLPAGVTHFIIHPSADTPELRAITPDWSCRVADYHTFQDERLREYVQSIGLHIIGYRALQDLMPQKTA
jgi:type IV secretory pathway VirJ component